MPTPETPLFVFLVTATKAQIIREEREREIGKEKKKSRKHLAMNFKTSMTHSFEKNCDLTDL